MSHRTRSREQVRPPLPLIYHWNDTDNPLPYRAISALTPSELHALHAASPWYETGPHDQPFDFCQAMRRLCEDVVAKCPELAHIDPQRWLIAVTQARNERIHGLQARVTPLRFAGGQLLRKRRQRSYQVQRFRYKDVEYLYLVTFCLPRFLNQDFDAKLVTLFHELHHISPAFDGDLRRFPGRYQLHSHSEKEYNERMVELAREYIMTGPAHGCVDFLRLDFAQLVGRHGSVIGIMVPRPKIVPVEVEMTS